MKAKKRWVLVILLSIFLLDSCTGSKAEVEGLLPSSVSAKGIKVKKDGEGRLYVGKRLFDYMNGGAELYYEYGFEQAFVQCYSFKGKQGRITVELYQMSTPQSAYGVYTFDTVGDHPKIGQDATYAEGVLSFWKDRYFVRALAEGEGLKEILLSLGEAIAKKIPAAGLRPAILKLLPPQWIISETLIYFRGPLALNNAYFLAHKDPLSLEEGAEGVTFLYKPEAQPLRVIMVRYSGRTESLAAFKTLCSSGVIKGGVKKGVLLGKGRRGYGGALVREQTLIIVLEAPNAEHVQRALRSLPYRGG